MLLTATERLTMNTRPKNPANARNLNFCGIGSSGSGKTRFWLTPQLLQAHSSYVVVDPKGSVLGQVGTFLQNRGYKIKVFNSIDFSKSMHYNRRVYELDEDGNRIRDANGKFVFNAVPTTDWGSPETLEHWREAWAELCNAKFAEKCIDVRIDHRSYERQGVELLPTVHEGATVRAMEKKGIRTEKGEFNRWIKATNAVIRDIKKKITLLFDWIAEAKAELAKPQAPDLVSLLNAYYTSRRAGAYSQKGKVSNLKEMNETFNYLRANGIYSLEDLEHRVSEHSAATESLKKTLDEQTARMKAIKQLYDSSAAFQSLKPVYDGLQKIKFEKPRAKYKAEHEAELIQFYAARRKLTGEFPDGKVDMKKLTEEYDELEQAHETTYGEFKAVRDDLHRLWKVRSCVDTAARFNERTEEQKLQNRPQTRHKKEDMTR